MPTTYISSVHTTAITLTADEDLVIETLGFISPATGTAITSTFDNADIQIDGTVAASNSAYGLDISGDGTTVVVAAEGLVFRWDATFLFAGIVFNAASTGGSVRNDGDIEADTALLSLSTAGGNSFVNYGDLYSEGSAQPNNAGVAFMAGAESFTNYGTVLADQYGIYIDAAVGGGTSDLTNTGYIGGATGLYVNAGSAVSLDNSGDFIGTSGTAIHDLGVGSVYTNSSVISGGINATAVTGSTEVINTGAIYGNVLFGAGADLYHGSANGAVAGAVIGGDGDDRLLGGLEVDRFYGDGGADKLRGGGGNDALFGGLGRDDIRGQGGEDIINGGEGNDVLRGGTGMDTIVGGRGNDKITGGRDADILTGGAGRDVFVFNRQTGDDEITDFTNDIDRLDLSVYRLTSILELTNAGAITAGLSGSIIDLTLIGGHGAITVEGMTVAQWDDADFIF